MKFTKTAIAVAIMGVAAAPLAQADVKLSGSIGIELGSSDADDADLTFAGDDSTINVSASHTMNNGLTGYGNYRLDSALTGSTPAADNVYVGMKGGFGDIRIGEVPDAVEYGQVAGDIYLDAGGENAGISYTGSFGPATLGLNWSPEGNNDRFGAGLKFNVGGFAIGVGGGQNGNFGADSTTVMTAGASFSAAGASIALAYKDLDGDVASAGAKIGYSVGDVGLGLTFEQGIGDANEDDSEVRLDIDYGMGGGMDLNFRVNMNDKPADDSTTYRVLLTKSY